MKSAHLTQAELVDWLDGTLTADGRRHFDECADCRGTAEALAATVAAAGDAAVPEPAAAFWPDLSARIHQRILAEPAHQGQIRRLLQPTARHWIGLATAAAIVLAVGLWRGSVDTPPSDGFKEAEIPGVSRGELETLPVTEPEMFGDVEADPAWAAVRRVADGLEAGELDSGIGARPGSVDALAQGMLDHERGELARLLEEEARVLREELAGKVKRQTGGASL